MPKVSDYYFKSAIIFLILGIGMGMQMAITEVHNVTGAHAHTNLLGWVTSALFGTYFALNPAKAASRLATIQYGVYTVGVVVMAGGLYMLLQGNVAFQPAVIIGSLITAVGVLLFAFILFAPAGNRRIVQGAAPAE